MEEPLLSKSMSIYLKGFIFAKIGSRKMKIRQKILLSLAIMLGLILIMGVYSRGLPRILRMGLDVIQSSNERATCGAGRK